MAMTRQRFKNDCIIHNTLDELVPQEHLVRKLDNCIDFTFVEELVKDLYSDFGRPSIPPVVLFKLIFINMIFGINSMRRTCEECKVNIAYRWFLGLSMYDDIPNYSTWSQNYIRRYKDSDVFDKIFEKILDQAIEYGFVDSETVFGDGTHQKANANKNKHKDVEVEIIKKVYEDELLKEINEDRINHSKKKIDSLTKKEVMFDEATGELIENKDTKHIKESITDPESGCFHKGEKEKCFAYTHQVFCDKNGYKQYKSNHDKCANCPLKDRCTKSKNHQKIILRHIWEEYKEQANENRYTQNWKENYPKRKETIERVFGDCKEQHNLRFTRVRGLLKNGQNTTLIFACHNLKK